MLQNPQERIVLSIDRTTGTTADNEKFETCGTAPHR